MRIDLPAPRRRGVSLTSLIDVIFLLLLFFMLSSTFTRFAEVEIAAPSGPGGAAPSPDTFAAIDGDGLAINGTRIAESDDGGLLAGLVAAGAKTVLLVPKNGARAQHLVTALERLRAAGPLQVVVAR